MSVAFQLPRSVRQITYDVLPGQTDFGPAPWLAFDPVDIAVQVRDGPAERWRTVTAGVTVALSAAIGYPTARFSVSPAAAQVRLTARRIHPRITDVTRGGAVLTPMLERELDTQATVLQELRRDVDQHDAFGVFVPEGETGFNLPPLAERVGRLAGWDGMFGRFEPRDPGSVSIVTPGTATVRDAMVAGDAAIQNSKFRRPTFPTLAEFRSAYIPATVRIATLDGLDLEGDVRSFDVMRLAVVPAPARPWHYQSADGAWWKMRVNRIRPEWFGDDLAVTFAAGIALDTEILFARGRTYDWGSTITIDGAVSVRIPKNTRLRYTQPGGHFLRVTAVDGFELVGGTIEGHAASTDGALIIIDGDGPYGSYAPYIRGVEFVNGRNQLQIEAAFEGRFIDCTFRGMLGTGFVARNSRSPNLGRHTIESASWYGRNYPVPTGIAIFHAGGSDLRVRNPFTFNCSTDYFCSLDTGVSLYNVIISNPHFQGSASNIYFTRRSGIVAANIVIEGGFLYGRNNVLSDTTAGWLHDITLDGVEFFPGLGGSGSAINLCANPVTISDCIFDGGDPNNGHLPLPGSGGITVQPGCYHWNVDNLKFTALEYNVNNLVPTEPTIRFTNCPGYYSQEVDVATPGASPFTYRAGPTPETLYINFNSGVNFSVVLGGVVVAQGTDEGFTTPTVVELNPHQAVAMSFTGSPTLVRNRH